jgi:predicted Zn-dependent protease
MLYDVKPAPALARKPLARTAALALAAALAFAPLPASFAQNANEGGVTVRKPSQLSKLVSAEQVEQASAAQYQQLKQQAAQKGTLLGPNDPQYQRVRRISQRMMPYASKWNSRASGWQWEINVLRSPQVNAFCMPGGKIAVYTGIIDKLQLSDAELAVVIGHEMTHALREHARAQIGKQAATSVGASVLSQIFGFGDIGNTVLSASAGLLTLRFSRDDESEADAIGLELAARAGYDPRAGVTLWQKMEKLNSQGGGPQWMSSHPSDANRVAEVQRRMPEVMPLYEKAHKA